MIGNGNAGGSYDFSANPFEDEPPPPNNNSAAKPEAQIVFRQLGRHPITSIPPRQWAYGYFLLFGAASVIGGVDGGGKGAQAVVIALAVITGKPLLGEKVWQTGSVAILTYEDDLDEWDRRIAAACLKYGPEHGFTYEEVKEHFHFVCRDNNERIRLAAHSITGRGVIFPDGDQIIEGLKTIGAALFIVDPFNHAHQLEDGNSNVMVAQVAGEISRICRAAMVAGLVLHHLRKGAVGDPDDLMGAVMLRATFRAARIMLGMTGGEAEELEIDPDEVWRYSRIAGSKENYAPPPNKCAWYRLDSQDIGNGSGRYVDGDNVQVFAQWKPNAAKAQRPKTELAEIFQRLRDGPSPGEFYSRHQTSNYWAGTMMMQITGKTEAYVKGLLRSWRKNAVILDGEYKSAAKERVIPCIGVNEDKARGILGSLYQPPPFEGGSAE